MGEKTPIKVTQAPLGNGIPRALIIVVVALIVIVVIFAVVPFLQNAFSPQPSVTLTNVVPTISGCTGGTSPKYYTYTWTFTLSNTGNTNANVTVSIVSTSALYSGASPLKSQFFTVQKASSPSGMMSTTLSSLGCSKVSLDVRISDQKVIP